MPEPCVDLMDQSRAHWPGMGRIAANPVPTERAVAGDWFGQRCTAAFDDPYNAVLKGLAKPLDVR
jgi:hypothetical protein